MSTTIDAGMVREFPMRRTSSRTLRSVRRFVVKKPLGTVGLILLLAFVFVAVFADQLERTDPNEIDPFRLLAPPSSDAWFGTDNLGRDIYSRAVHGARVAMIVGLLTPAVAAVAGTIIGLASGYFGGVVDATLQRIMDAIMAFPALVLALLLVTALDRSVLNIVWAIAFITTPGFSRVVRGSVLSVKQNTYIEAAHALGQNSFWILLRHILPNVMAPIIVVMTASVATAILAEAGISFLGLGPPPPDATWGQMMTLEARFYLKDAWWMGLVPGVAIPLAVLSANLFGDALRDVLDPRLRGA